MWKAVTAILILALIAAGAVFVLPTVVEERIVDALKQQTAAEDVQISITDSPRLVFGEIGAVDGVMRQGRVGKLFVRELTVSGTVLKVDMMALLREHKVENRTHSKGYVEDFPPKCGRKRCVKMVVLNLSVLPKAYTWPRCVHERHVNAIP